MDNEIAGSFLNDMPFKEFLVLYIWAFLGMIITFLLGVKKSIRNNKSTSDSFEWQYFWKGVRRTLATLILMAVLIIFWDKVSSFLFTDPIELTGWSAFIIIGAGSDKITDELFGNGQEAGKYIVKKLKNNE